MDIFVGFFCLETVNKTCVFIRTCLDSSSSILYAIQFVANQNRVNNPIKLDVCGCPAAGRAVVVTSLCITIVYHRCLKLYISDTPHYNSIVNLYGPMSGLVLKMSMH